MIGTYRKHPRASASPKPAEPPFEAVFSCPAPQAEPPAEPVPQAEGLRTVAYRDTCLRTSDFSAVPTTVGVMLQAGEQVRVVTPADKGVVEVETSAGVRGWLSVVELAADHPGTTGKPVVTRRDPLVQEPPSPPAAPELTPSDAVFLRAVPWRAVDVDGATRFESRLLPPGAVLPAIRQALLALEGTGALSFEVVRKKSFWGGYSTSLWLVPRATGRRWPSGSLEAQLPRDGRLQDGIAGWIGDASATPYAEVAVDIGFRLVSRGLLRERTETRRFLKVFSFPVRTWVMPPATASLLQGSLRRSSLLPSHQDVDLVDREIAAAFSKKTTRDYSD